MKSDPRFKTTTQSFILQEGFDFFQLYGHRNWLPVEPNKIISYNCTGNGNGKTVVETASCLSTFMPLTGFNITDFADFEYSAWCLSNNIIKYPNPEGFFHLVDYNGIYQLMPGLFLSGIKVMLARRFRRSRYGRYRVDPFTLLYGRFDTCTHSTKGGTTRIAAPNANVYNMEPSSSTQHAIYTLFEVFRELYFEAGYVRELRKTSGFRFSEGSMQMQILDGLIMNGTEAKMVGRRSTQDGTSMASIRDWNATLFYKETTDHNVSAEMLFSGDGQYSLMIRSTRMWYKLFRDAHSPEMRRRIDCTNIEQVVGKAEVKFSFHYSYYL